MIGTQMFHDEFWKIIYFGVKRSKTKVTSLCRSSDRTQYYRCCVCKPRWVSPL